MGRGMTRDSDTSSIPAPKSHIMISLRRVMDQPTRMINEKSGAYKSISILKEGPRERRLRQEKVVESIPYKTIQLKLLSPFTEFLYANHLVPSHVRADLPPYHYILGIHYAGTCHLGGAGAVEVGKAKWSGCHEGIKVAVPPAKEERMLWVSRYPIQLHWSVVVPSAVVEDCPRRDRRGSYGMP